MALIVRPTGGICPDVSNRHLCFFLPGPPFCLDGGSTGRSNPVSGFHSGIEGSALECGCRTHVQGANPRMCNDLNK
jgi:hypothetical protein